VLVKVLNLSLKIGMARIDCGRFISLHFKNNPNNRISITVPKLPTPTSLIITSLPPPLEILSKASEL
jgi:hypothetical protein